MIELLNINKSYGNLRVLTDISLSIGSNEIITIVGPSGSEFLIDFIFAAPGMPQAPVVSRVIMSPENAKKLLFALTDNIQKYEAQFGEIAPRPGKIGNN